MCNKFCMQSSDDSQVTAITLTAKTIFQWPSSCESTFDKKNYTVQFIHHFRILHKEQLVLLPSQKFTCLAFHQHRESVLSVVNLGQKGTTYSRLPLWMKFLLLINNVNMVKENGLVIAVLLINKQTLI